MVESAYVSIQEAARRCGVSGKTIQRAIQAGKLVAHYPKRGFLHYLPSTEGHDAEAQARLFHPRDMP